MGGRLSKPPFAAQDSQSSAVRRRRNEMAIRPSLREAQRNFSGKLTPPPASMAEAGGGGYHQAKSFSKMSMASWTLMGRGWNIWNISSTMPWATVGKMLLSGL